ncbi:MAG: peptidylprolyl isomerase [Elusimicrobia bacterium]|nr:peptidylprolyl isomerase [Elusimicrobiota bacterium]MBD3412598.1 peptidylprolyl isomerase [Elusimicrobiota bacterium]
MQKSIGQIVIGAFFLPLMIAGVWAVEPAKQLPSASEETNQSMHTKKQNNEKKPYAVIETSLGTITFKFFPDVAPNTVGNFIKLAEEKFYDGLIFHRVIKGFMIQGGCPKKDGTGGPGYTIKAEFNDRKHVLGTVSMARAQDPDSAGSQFFICLADAPWLDKQYTVFGQVVEGIDTVKKIGSVKTTGNQHTGNYTPPFDKPLNDVVIKKIEIMYQ